MEPFLGQITIFPYNFTPVGWLPCLGQQMIKNDNQALFALLGTKFGGDGVNFFALPDYQKLAPEGSGYFIAIQGVFPPRQ